MCIVLINLVENSVCLFLCIYKFVKRDSDNKGKKYYDL